MAEQSASIRPSMEYKGRKRRDPVWIGRYRIVARTRPRCSARLTDPQPQLPRLHPPHLREHHRQRTPAPLGVAANRQRDRPGDRRLPRGAGPRNLAASTLNQTPAIVHGIFALAAERYGVEDDPSLAFKRARTRRATSDKISFHRPEEVMRLVKHAENEQDAALLLTAAFTGLRASELRALPWRSVDFVGEQLAQAVELRRAV